MVDIKVCFWNGKRSLIDDYLSLLDAKSNVYISGRYKFEDMTELDIHTDADNVADIIITFLLPYELDHTVEWG